MCYINDARQRWIFSSKKLNVILIFMAYKYKYNILFAILPWQSHMVRSNSNCKVRTHKIYSHSQNLEIFFFILSLVFSCENHFELQF